MKPPIIENIQLNAYDAHDYLEYKNKSQSNRIINVKVLLCRKLSYHIVNIYIPTLCLIMIAGFTLFIDLSRFEATIMVALTTMLVTYTLYQSISEYLPHTSYMKMIDIWLFGGLILPFFVIAILVIMDSLIILEKNKVIDMTKDEKKRVDSKTFMKSMQILLSVISGILCVIYWSYGLYHYYLSCTI